MGPEYTMLRPCLFFKFFFLEKSLLLLMEQPPPRASSAERDLGYKCRLFLKSGLVPFSAIDGIAQAETIGNLQPALTWTSTLRFHA